MGVVRFSGRRTLAGCSAILAVLAIGACGGSSSAKVGDCIDVHKHVVDCSASDATQKLVTDLGAKKAIACVQIGDKPQVEVKVDNHPFCAENK